MSQANDKMGKAGFLFLSIGALLFVGWLVYSLFSDTERVDIFLYGFLIAVVGGVLLMIDKQNQDKELHARYVHFVDLYLQDNLGDDLPVIHSNAVAFLNGLPLEKDENCLLIAGGRSRSLRIRKHEETKEVEAGAEIHYLPKLKVTEGKKDSYDITDSETHSGMLFMTTKKVRFVSALKPFVLLMADITAVTASRSENFIQIESASKEPFTFTLSNGISNPPVMLCALVIQHASRNARNNALVADV